MVLQGTNEFRCACRTVLSCVLLTAAFSLPQCGMARATSDGQDWDSMIARLRKAGGITASLVGFAHVPSSQFALYEAVIAAGDSARFHALIGDENPVVRCVGLLALAQTGGEESVTTLRRHLADRGTTRFQRCDIFSNITVGQFAFRLLRDKDFLEIKKPYVRSPLLSESKLMSLYIESLADDAATSVHEEAAYYLPRALTRDGTALDLPTLKAHAPSLEDWQIVKAVGRLKRSESSQACLLACLEDVEMPPEVRLAAASALTRHTDKRSSDALRRAREALNRLDDERWGDHFVAILDARCAHEKNMEFLRKVWSHEVDEAMKNRVIEAFASDHPVALADLSDVPAAYMVDDHADVRQALGDSIVAISRNLERFSQPWSTYADTAFKLDLLAIRLRMYRRRAERLAAKGINCPGRMSFLTEAQCAEIQKNVNRFIAR